MDLSGSRPAGGFRSATRYAALFLISFSLIAFELAIMRVFSAGSWSNFGSMVISIALLGYGVAGVGLTFIQERVRKNAAAWLAGSAALLPAVMALCYSLAQKIPFNPIFLISQPRQSLYIACFYVLYSLPFLVGAVFTAAAFMVPGERIQGLYFWNMAGSGLGGLALILSTYALKTEYLVYPVTALAAVAAFLALPGRSPAAIPEGKAPGSAMSRRWPIFAGLATAAAFLLLVFAGKMNISPYKASEQARLMFPDLKVVHEEHGPLGEYEIYDSERFHFAPGLSDNAVFYIDEMPKKAFWGMYIDNDGPIGIMRRLNAGEEKYIDFLPMSAAYALLDEPKVLLVKLGGGFSAYAALHHQAAGVTILEPNPVIAGMSRDVPAVRQFNGDLLRDPRVRVVEEEPRAFCARDSSGTYDLVELSLIDSIGLSQSTGYSITENYLYTVEAMTEYLKRLGPDGVLSVTVWNSLSPPRNVPKLIATVVEALKRSGYSDPAAHLYGFDLIYSTATLLVKKSAFTPEDLKRLDAFCAKMSFKSFYAPGQADPGKDFDAILAAYRDKFTTKKQVAGQESEDPSGGTVRLDVEDLYAYSARWALAGKQGQLYDKYLFDIRPTTDDRPYYSVYMKPSTAPLFLDKLTYASEDWSYFLSWATLFQAIGFGLVIALLPLLKRRKKEIGIGKGRTFGVIGYYAFLGAGYMLVEIFLMQKLVFFLAEPVFSTSIVITSMLIISGLGSLFSERLSPDPAKRVRIAVIAICSVLALYAFALPPLLGLLLGLPLWAKIPIAVAAIAPAAFFMGMPFPNGLSRLGSSGPSLLPWAYGVNGALSVTGSLLAQIVSMHSGYVWVLGLAFALYAGAGVLFPVNEAGRAEKAAKGAPAA
jgi:hypothetical protein